MDVEGFAVGVAEEGGAVVDFKGELGGLVCLVLGDGREPGAEGLAVLGGVETEEVGGSVGVSVTGVEEEGYRDAIEAMAPEEMELGVARIDRGLQDAFDEGVVGFKQA